MFLKCSYSSSLKDGHYKISGYDDGNDDSNEVNNKKEKSLDQTTIQQCAKRFVHVISNKY